MRRIVIAIVYILASTLIFSSCDKDPYKGKRPTDYPDSKWVCDDYNISFNVDSNGSLQNGFIEEKNKKIQFDISWSALDSSAVFYKIEDSKKVDMFTGECVFSENEFTVKVNDSNGYLKDKSATLKFIHK